MVTAAAARRTRRTRRTGRTPAPKPETLVQIRIVEPHAGLYRALSSDGRSWYVVDVTRRLCSCPSGAHGFHGVQAHGGQCKHLVGARTVARMLASMTPEARAVVLRMTKLQVRVDRIDVAALDAPLGQLAAATAAPRPLNRHRGSAAGLLEAFGA